MSCIPRGWSLMGFRKSVSRAAIGNQTPYYFHGLWVWQRIFGDGELAMRASSILFSALAAGTLTLGIAVQTRRIAVGIIAGGIIAVESNAVFFGCELRAYAVVMFCASCAVWMSARMMDLEKQCGRTRFLLVLSVCIAALLHPTSMGVLGILVVASFIVAVLRKKLVFTRWDAISIALVSVVVMLLAISSLPDSWSRREQWRVFASAKTAQDFWVKSWAWMPIVYVPFGVGACLAIVALVRKHRQTPYGTFVPVAIGTIATLVFFFASYFEIVPLWHRRYFIAALPLLAWSAGMLSGFALPKSRISAAIGSLIAIFLLTNLLWYQGTLGVLTQGAIPRQLRNEHWREAVEFVSKSKGPDDTVWVDAALIEGAIFQKDKDSVKYEPIQEDYLAFPLRGPYRIENGIPIALHAHESWRAYWVSKIRRESNTVWILTRGRSNELISRFTGLNRNGFGEIERVRIGTIGILKIRRQSNELARE